MYPGESVVLAQSVYHLHVVLHRRSEPRVHAVHVSSERVEILGVQTSSSPIKMGAYIRHMKRKHVKMSYVSYIFLHLSSVTTVLLPQLPYYFG